MEQWMEETPKVQYVRLIEKILYDYPFMMIAIEQTEDDYPSMTASYDETIRGSNISKPTEQYGIKRAEKYLKVNRIDKAMTNLSDIESELIKKKYFDTTQPSDFIVLHEMNISNATYYKIKDRALRKIAIALNII